MGNLCSGAKNNGQGVVNKDGETLHGQCPATDLRQPNPCQTPLRAPGRVCSADPQGAGPFADTRLVQPWGRLITSAANQGATWPHHDFNLKRRSPLLQVASFP